VASLHAATREPNPGHATPDAQSSPADRPP
jgi:hypothetical protein